MAKFSNLSNWYSCEPKIVPAHLIPVNDNNKILWILRIDLGLKSPHYEIWLKNANFMGEFNCLQCMQSYESIDYNMSTYLCIFNKLIWLTQNNEKIDILSLVFMPFTGNKSPGAKKGSDVWQWDNFPNIFWVKRTFTLRDQFSPLKYKRFCKVRKKACVL